MMKRLELLRREGLVLHIFISSVRRKWWQNNGMAAENAQPSRFSHLTECIVHMRRLFDPRTTVTGQQSTIQV